MKVFNLVNYNENQKLVSNKIQVRTGLGEIGNTVSSYYEAGETAQKPITLNVNGDLYVVCRKTIFRLNGAADRWQDYGSFIFYQEGWECAKRLPEKSLEFHIERGVWKPLQKRTLYMVNDFKLFEEEVYWFDIEVRKLQNFHRDLRWKSTEINIRYIDNDIAYSETGRYYIKLAKCHKSGIRLYVYRLISEKIGSFEKLLHGKRLYVFYRKDMQFLPSYRSTELDELVELPDIFKNVKSDFKKMLDIKEKLNLILKNSIICEDITSQIPKKYMHLQGERVLLDETAMNDFSHLCAKKFSLFDYLSEKYAIPGTGPIEAEPEEC